MIFIISCEFSQHLKLKYYFVSGQDHTQPDVSWQGKKFS